MQRTASQESPEYILRRKNWSRKSKKKTERREKSKEAENGIRETKVKEEWKRKIKERKESPGKFRSIHLPLSCACSSTRCAHYGQVTRTKCKLRFHESIPRPSILISDDFHPFLLCYFPYNVFFARSRLRETLFDWWENRTDFLVSVIRVSFKMIVEINVFVYSNAFKI